MMTACAQDEYDEVETQYKIEKAELIELELRFEPLEAEFKAILNERDIAYRALMAAEREHNRRLQSALALQAWWRSYRVRKACQLAEKKRVKAASKGKKKEKGGKKGKKGKKETQVEIAAEEIPAVEIPPLEDSQPQEMQPPFDDAPAAEQLEQQDQSI